MKKIISHISLVLALVMVVTMFAGCSKQAQDSANTTETQVTAAQQSTVQEVKKDPVKIKYACFDYELFGYDKRIITAFQDANPDIAVDVIDIAAAEYPDKMTIMLAGGESVDAFLSKRYPDYAAYILRNQVLPIDDLVSQDKLDLTPYGNYIQPLKVNDKLYGLPYRSDFWVLGYNKDIFDNAKMSYPSNDWTWDDFKDAAVKLTSGEGDKKVYGAYIWASRAYSYTIPGLQKMEGSLVDGDFNIFKDGFQMFYDMTMTDKSASDFATNKSMSSPDPYTAFSKGNIAMAVTGTWLVSQMAQGKTKGQHNINWGFAQIPSVKGKEDSSPLVVTPVVINSTTKNVNEAWKLAKFVAGEQSAQILTDELLFPGYMNDSIKKKITDNELFPKDGVDALKTNILFTEYPPSKISGLIDKMLIEELGMIMTGNKTVDQGIAEMETRRNEIKEQNK